MVTSRYKYVLQNKELFVELGKVSEQSQRKASFTVLLKLDVNHFVSGRDFVETFEN